MSINVRCGSCNSSFKVKDEFAGKRGKCPNCKAGVQVPHIPERQTEIAELQAPQTPQIVHAQPRPAPPQPIAIQQRVEVHREETNGLGTAGFIVSLIGILTCGFLSPIGLLFSLIALFKAPRGMAIAGFVLGGMGSLWVFFVGFAMVMGFMGLGAAAVAVGQIGTTVSHVLEASEEIMESQKENGQFPDNETGQKMVEKHVDGYGKPLRYTLKDEESFEIRSAGSDGKFDTVDDYEQTFPSTSLDLD